MNKKSLMKTLSKIPKSHLPKITIDNSLKINERTQEYLQKRREETRKLFGNLS